MDEQTNPRKPCLWQRDGALLALLVLLAAGIHAWVILHTEVAARDSIAFITYAWRLEHEPPAAVLRSSLHPPLYPLTVLAVSVPLRQMYHGPEAVLMQYSAQVASTLAGLLLIFPMFYLGKQLFDRRVGFWSALLFQCLPVGSRALSDGLTEGLFLLLIATGLLLAVYAFRRGSLLLFGLMGLCGGLAYLTRPEGAMLLVAAGLVLMSLRQLPEAWRPGRPRLRCLAAMGVAALLVSVPYMATIGGVSNKTTAGWIFDWFAGRAHAAEPHVAPLTAAFFQDWKEYRHGAKLTWGVMALVQESGKSFHYVAWLPALLGLGWFRSRWRTEPGVRVLLLLCVLHIALVLRVAVVAGYVSERHTLLLVLCGCPWAVAGTFALVGYILTWSERLRQSAPMIEVAAVAVLVLTGVPRCLKSLHSNRAGHRAAGHWLVEHARPWDEVKDPFCWAKYYAGREFCALAPVPEGETGVTYIIMDTASHHSRLPQLDEAKNLIRERNGQVCFEWPDPATGKRSTVQVYEIPAPVDVAHQ